MGIGKKFGIGLTVAAAVVAFACSGGSSGGRSSGDKARQDCRLRGGTYQKTGEHSGRCVPPVGGWR